MITIHWWVLLVVAVTAGSIGAMFSLLWFAICAVSKWADNPTRDAAELWEKVVTTTEHQLSYEDIVRRLREVAAEDEDASEWIHVNPARQSYIVTGTDGNLDYRELPY